MVWFATSIADYENHRECDAEFSVPKSWFESWFEKKRKEKVQKPMDI